MSEPVGVQVGRVCPGCGREDSVPLRWGMPAVEDFRLAERGLVALGGCLLPGEEPILACRSCGLEWGRERDPTADEQALADLLGVQYADVVRALGRGWRRENAASDDGMQWFISGEPAQVAVGVDDLGFVLARPLTSWDGGRTDLLPTDGSQFRRDDLLWSPDVIAEAAEIIAARRRRSFRWCRTCRRAHAPESFVGAAGACRPCASAFTGVEA
ncbi:hypothetical protein [Geodermatophilus chilensis]|uniref:hypothetical protein n=1 Tax=Geodermatophilus chilensis TaxID=2035835 RepID=UPI000C25DFEE|nr:hypothetical protein [Geodermatophilus chilensis]